MKYKGELFVLGSLALWGLFPLMTKTVLVGMDVILALAFISFFASIRFFVFFLKNKEWKYFKSGEGWKYLLATVFIIGILFYALNFYGVKYTTPVNVSIFALSEIFFSYLFFGILFTDKKSSWNEIGGTLLMLVGGLIILFPGEININYGDVFIIIAALFASFGNNFAKKATSYFSTNFLMLIRSLISSIFLFVIFYVMNGSISFDFDTNTWIYLIFIGMILFGFSKYLWVEALKLIGVARASSFIVLYPIFTIIYGLIFFATYPEMRHLVGLIPVVLGVLVLFEFRVFWKKQY